MMWALLDIRTGRANRAQFLLFVLLYIGMMSIYHSHWGAQQTINLKSYFSIFRLLFLLAASYVFFVGMVRRYRDIGLQWPATLFIVIVVFFTIISFTPAGFALILLHAYFLPFASAGTLEPFSVLRVMFYAVFFLPLLRAGDPKPNEYGYPPINLSLGTMTAATYPKNLLKKQREEANQRDRENFALEEAQIQEREAFYRDNLKNRHAETQETQEFKGRG